MEMHAWFLLHPRHAVTAHLASVHTGMPGPSAVDALKELVQDGVIKRYGAGQGDRRYIYSLGPPETAELELGEIRTLR
jgi:DNA-binding MarR family transcriptional regulator